MKICIVGAGSIGGYVAFRLAAAGLPVSVLVRGANLAAIRQHGLRLIAADDTQASVRPARASDNAAELGPQDAIVLAVKAHQVADLVPRLAPLLQEDTVIVPMQNGVPWWYFQRRGGPFAGRAVRAVDPQGAVAAAVEARRIVGCVVYPACELAAPGVIRHIEGHRFPLGELDGTRSERAGRLSAAFESGALKAPVLEDIRAEMWLKLWGNAVFNPLSALTRGTLAEICADAPLQQLARNMMLEVEAVAASHGVRMRVPLERRIAGAASVGAHKTSMLQDIEAGRATELDALLGSVIELAELAAVAVPHLRAVYACVRQLEARAAAPVPSPALVAA
jgi:2-dehydropantoate 2-reductase